MSDKLSFFSELKRRNVYKVAVAYAVVGWLAIQAASIVLPTFHAPEWTLQTIIALVTIGFPIALVIAWAFEVTPGGIKRTEDADALLATNAGGSAPRPPKKRTWIYIYIIAIGAALSVGLFFLGRYTAGSRSSTTQQPPAKSIAVLPFENLSDDKSNAYFADGIQDEILTRLSKIADLKVISRTSTQKYKSAPDNLREVGKQLGVANLVEGSVQKVANAVHVNVQMIRASSDEHLWAESYDRKLDDIFGVEGEVAQSIASALNARLSGAEQAALTEKPTNNQAAYDAYLRGNTLMGQANDDASRAAVQSYEEAVRLDPQFALAWAKLSSARSVGFYFYDATPAGRAAAETSLAEAERLKPQLAETQLARAYFDYFIVGDDKRVLNVLDQLRLIWPSNAEIFELLAFTYERLGEWAKAVDYMDQAIALNPRDLFQRRVAAYLRCDTRDFLGALRSLDEALQIWPGDVNLLGIKAQVFQARGQLNEAQSIVDGLEPSRVDYDAIAAIWYQAKLRRSPGSALKILEPFAKDASTGLGNACIVANLEELAGDKPAAHETYVTIHDRASALQKEQPDNVRFPAALAFAFAGLGERDEALRAIDRVSALRSHDARVAPATEEDRARILTRFGEKDSAITILQHLLKTPYEGPVFDPPLTPALLRLDPDWDNLRGDPRFENLCQEPAK